MKTSLNIEDSIFEAAQQEALKSHKTVSELISYWARVGREMLRKQLKARKKQLKPVNLGGPAQIDINSRRDWMDLLDS